MDIAALLADCDMVPTQAEEQRPTPPPRTAALRAVLRYATTAFPPDLAVRALSLAGKLPDEDIEILLDLWTAVDDRAVTAGADWERQTWERILAHVPGLAPALNMIRAHVLEEEPTCAACGCQLEK